MGHVCTYAKKFDAPIILTKVNKYELELYPSNDNRNIQLSLFAVKATPLDWILLVESTIMIHFLAKICKTNFILFSCFFQITWVYFLHYMFIAVVYVCFCSCQMSRQGHVIEKSSKVALQHCTPLHFLNKKLKLLQRIDR